MHLVGCLPECLPLLGGPPVAKPDAQLLHALDPPCSSCKIGAEEPAVCRLVSKTAHRPETKVDGARSEIAGLQMHSVPEDHRFAERQARLGAVPLHEFVNCMAIAALGIGARKAVEDRGFRGFEVGQSQDRLRTTALFATRFSLHDLWPPNATG